jgi:hypothetical protein
MASIGADIKEVMDELGVTATILRSPTNITEKITTEADYVSSTNPFMQEHHTNIGLNYNTQVVTGDLLQILNDYHLVIAKVPDMFEGEMVEFTAALYKCNVSGAVLLIPVQTQDPDTFKLTSTWNVRKTGVRGVLHQYKRSAPLEPETSAGRNPIFELEMFVPASYGAVINDRVYISATEYFRILDIEKYKLPGIHTLTLVQDDRVVYTP